MINAKIFAVIVSIVVICGACVGGYYISQPQSSQGVNDYAAVSDPSSEPSEITNQTINAVNSTIIVGDGSDVIYPNQTVTPTSTPQPLEITYTELSNVLEPGSQYSATYQVIMLEIHANNAVDMTKFRLIMNATRDNDMWPVVAGQTLEFVVNLSIMGQSTMQSYGLSYNGMEVKQS